MASAPEEAAAFPVRKLMRRFKVVTLGCKLNQCESEELRLRLAAKGFRPCCGGEGAEVVVVNTCTVTEKAAHQSRQAIRRAIRENPGAFVVVTGCLAETEPASVRSIPGVGGVAGRTAKEYLAESLPTRLASPDARTPPVPASPDSTALPAAGDPPAGRTRAFLKIQDGCDAY